MISQENELEVEYPISNYVWVGKDLIIISLRVRGLKTFRYYVQK